ncbi:MAG: hypothetical protein N2C14_18990 [Planctomycetales bacterium]
MTTQRILVRGREPGGWSFGLQIVGMLSVVGSIGMFVAQAPVAASTVLCVIGGLLLVGAKTHDVVNKAKRRWMAVSSTGFRIMDGQGERDYQDNQIIAVSRASEGTFQGGVSYGYRVRMDLWTDQATEPIDLDYLVKNDEEDPFADWIVRMLTDLEERLEHKLQQGGTAEGDDWSMDAKSINARQGAFQVSVALDDVSEIGIFEGQISLWKKGEERAFAKISPASKNADMLRVLIGKRLNERDLEAAEARESLAKDDGFDSFADRNEEARNQDDSEGMGRILFERKSHGEMIGIIVLAVGGISVGVVVFLNEAPGFGALLMTAGVAFGIGAAFIKPAVFRCHESGVFQGSTFGEKELRYKDVQSFSYSATRHFVNGAYTGTQVAMNFTALGKDIRYNANVQNQDDDLDGLRDHVSTVIAGRMLQELGDGGSPRWTSGLRFTPQGIEYRSSGWIKQGGPQTLPYEEIGGVDVNEGMFFLFNSANAVVAKEEASADNFFPGFIALMNLLGSDESEESEQPE